MSQPGELVLFHLLREQTIIPRYERRLSAEWLPRYFYFQCPPLDAGSIFVAYLYYTLHVLNFIPMLFYNITYTSMAGKSVSHAYNNCDRVSETVVLNYSRNGFS